MRTVTSFLFTLLMVYSTVNAQTDVAGSRDHPLITRYPASYIGYYEEQKFKSYEIATGPVTGYKQISEWTKAEGKFTRIYYIVKGTATIDEVYGNYMSALKKAGFKILAQGIDPQRNVGKEVGGSVFIKTFYEKNPYPTEQNINLTSGSATSGGTCYMAAQMTNNKGGSVYAILGGSQYKSDEKVFLLDIIEESSMEDDLIKVSATEMMNGIKTGGKVVIYGILFEFDKADVKPESATVLSEISKMLNENPGLNLYVVGHTDMKGSYDYNKDLSEKRAAAVVNDLVQKHHINAARLSSAGVGPLVPVATNETEAGRKLNRRVELVMKN